LIKGQEICEAKHDRMEKFTAKNPNDQYEVISKLSHYFDGRGSLFIPQFIVGSSIDSDYLLALNRCPVDKKTLDNFYHTYKAAAGTTPKKFLNNDLIQADGVEQYLQSLAPNALALTKKNKA